MPITRGTTDLPWIASVVPRSLMARLPRRASRPLALHEAEMPARHYLASRGVNPLVGRPLRRALPMLLREVVRDRVAAWRDLLLALAMIGAALALLGSSPNDPQPGQAARLLYFYLQPMLALSATAWAMLLLLVHALPRLRRAHRVGAPLRRGDWPAAFRAAAEQPSLP